MEADMLTRLAWQEFFEMKKTAKRIAPWASYDDVTNHDPKWHEYGILRHTQAVLTAALEIYQMTSHEIDVTREAIWHDIGKFIVRKEKTDKPGEYGFKGHEQASAEFCSQRKFSPDQLLLIANHGQIRGNSNTEKLRLIFNNDVFLITKLLFLAAADTAGKGNTAAQKDQKKRLTLKFQQISKDIGLSKYYQNLLQQIVLS